MVAVGQFQVIKVCDGAVGLCNELVLVIAGNIDAVNIHTDGVGVNAGGVLVLNIVHVSINTQSVGGEHGAILDIGVVHTNRVDNGSVDIVNIGAVNELEVIKVKLAGALSADHLGSVNEHKAECHFRVEGEGTCPLGEVSLKIMPAFPVDTGLNRPFAGIFIIALLNLIVLGLKGEVNLTFFALTVSTVCTQPKTGNKLSVFIFYAAVIDTYAFGSIDPNAETCGSAGNMHFVGCTYTGTFGDSAAVSKVKVKLHGMSAEADGLVIVNGDDLN